MRSLLYWHLNATCPEAVPEAVLDRLRDHFHDNARRNLLLTGELLKLLALFETRGVPVVPYKGPVLASSVYGNLALREFLDLDILIHERDVPKARELLVSLGYRQQDPLTPVQEAAFLRSQCEHLFECSDGRSFVDLHWGITARHFSFPLDPRRLWERLERVPLGGSIVSTLSPEDLLLILCVHGSKHLWVSLSWICDVAELLRVNREIDWEWVTDQANTLGGERMLFLGLFLANDLLGAPLPERVMQRVRADSTVKKLAGEVQERLFQKLDGPPGIFDESPFQPFHLKVRERLRDKVRYLILFTFTPIVREWTLLPLPKSLFPLYYVVRPVRLAVKYGRRLQERLRASRRVS